MKKFIMAAGLLLSMNASAIDLSKTIVADPVADSTEITAAIAARGAILVAPVTCHQKGTPDNLSVICGTTRRVVYPDNMEDQSFGCWMEYSLNADSTWTRTSWECPIL
jgi:hypothetical protein